MGVFFIPVYNQIKEFPGVLQDLHNNALPIDTILLVNNGSTDGCEALVRKSIAQAHSRLSKRLIRKSG